MRLSIRINVPSLILDIMYGAAIMCFCLAGSDWFLAAAFLAAARAVVLLA